MTGDRMSDIDKLRAYFKGLTTAQKREFISNLQKRIAGVPNSKYAPFLAECIKAVKSIEKPESPDLSAEVFARAIASFLNAPAKAKPSSEAIARRLRGKWQRVTDDKVFYYHFNDDGTFETNEIEGHGVLKGHYSTGIDGALLIEPHDLVQFSSLMFSGNGSQLTIGLPNGVLVEYSKK
ncbi:MAG: hypothetical protein FWE05_13005 [Defluviitaleaceae bacterium]|nr:hypothetical protein [Defluviitaleaceae bacterium]